MYCQPVVANRQHPSFCKLALLQEVSVALLFLNRNSDLGAGKAVFLWGVTLLCDPQMTVDRHSFGYLDSASPEPDGAMGKYITGNALRRRCCGRCCTDQLVCAYWIEKLAAFPESGASSNYVSIPGKSIIFYFLILNSYSTCFEDASGAILPTVFLTILSFCFEPCIT